MRIQIQITELVLIALSLDDVCMHEELRIDVTRKDKKHYVVAGEHDDVAMVLDDIQTRSSRKGEWDQDASWMKACRRAWPNVVKQVEAQGLKVGQKGYGTVTLTPQ